MPDSGVEYKPPLREPTSSHVDIVRDHNKVQISQPDGKSTILYAWHLRKDDASRMPRDVAGLFFESVDNYNYLDRAIVSQYDFRNNFQYKDWVPYLKENEIPAYFADVVYKDIFKQPIAQNIFSVPQAVEPIAGLFLGYNIASRVRKYLQTKQISRREFLTATAKTVTAAWLNSPIITSIANALALEINKGQAQTNALLKKSNDIHPELYVTTLIIRNTLIAYKEQWLRKQLNSNVHLGTVMGANHVGLEDDLVKSPEELLDILRKTKPIWEKLAIPESMYTLVRQKFTDDMKDIEPTYFVIPELKQLVEE